MFKAYGVVNTAYTVLW